MLAGMGASINVFRMVIIFLRIQSLAALSKLSIHGMHVLGIQFFFLFCGGEIALSVRVAVPCINLLICFYQCVSGKCSLGKEASKSLGTTTM